MKTTITVALDDPADVELFIRLVDDVDFDWPVQIDADVDTDAVIISGTDEVLGEFTDWLRENFDLSFTYR